MQQFPLFNLHVDERTADKRALLLKYATYAVYLEVYVCQHEFTECVAAEGADAGGHFNRGGVGPEYERALLARTRQSRPLPSSPAMFVPLNPFWVFR